MHRKSVRKLVFFFGSVWMALPERFAENCFDRKSDRVGLAHKVDCLSNRVGHCVNY